ncbi:MAG: lipopolysaccharide kinase InaA family protein [gamma proteobacterium symbiont of Taylorina sp.]|nr:lipopolysaccharide kinase InaA family protein [gamma proteobacterium symbiont of Taylorina sp.]
MDLWSKKLFWHIMPEYRDTSLGKLFKNFNNAYHYEGEFVDGNVYKVLIDNKIYYLKKYSRFKRILPRYFSFSKVKREWKNLLWFQKIGIPVAKVVAYGQETQGVVVQRGLLITEELQDCYDLSYIVNNRPSLIKQADWIAEVSHQLACIARRLHTHHFAHNDFKWRNIMVDIKAKSPKIYLIDCPAGMKWYQPFLGYRIIKDLACLDKLAKYHLSQSRRMAFYKDYTQCKKLTSTHKKQIRQILKFFHNRE